MVSSSVNLFCGVAEVRRWEDLSSLSIAGLACTVNMFCGVLRTFDSAGVSRIGVPSLSLTGVNSLIVESGRIGEEVVSWVLLIGVTVDRGEVGVEGQKSEGASAFFEPSSIEDAAWREGLLAYGWINFK